MKQFLNQKDYDNARNQLQNHSTPGKLRTKCCCIEIGRRKFLHFIRVSPSPKQTQLMIEKKGTMCGFSSVFCPLELPKGLVSVLPHLKELAYFGYPGAFENKRELGDCFSAR